MHPYTRLTSMRRWIEPKGARRTVGRLGSDWAQSSGSGGAVARVAPNIVLFSSSEGSLGSSAGFWTSTGSISYRLFSSSDSDKTSQSSLSKQPSSARRKASRQRNFVPRKAPVNLTPKARNFFRALLENAPNPDVIGILLTYDQSSTGEPRMVFGFTFVTQEQLSPRDEGVSLEVLDDGTPRPPDQALNDGLPKLYVQEHAFMKVLGCTLDVDEEQILPILYDREGNLMDPNA